jgi:hypothetical protein
LKGINHLFRPAAVVIADLVRAPARAMWTKKIAWVPEDGVLLEFGMVVGPVIRIAALPKAEPQAFERTLDFIEIPPPDGFARSSKGLFPVVIGHPHLPSFFSMMISYTVSSTTDQSTLVSGQLIAHPKSDFPDKTAKPMIPKRSVRKTKGKAGAGRLIRGRSTEDTSEEVSRQS